jgi:DNA-3-methyladenine glycosylase I
VGLSPGQKGFDMQMTNELRRCAWCGTDPLYVRYHDEEWGRVVDDDDTMFELLILEGAQAGLSWLAILQRRENYRKAFADFDACKVAQFTELDVERLLTDTGIIRNRMKIKAAILNAQQFLKVQKEYGSFCAYLRFFLPDGTPIINHWHTPDEVPTSTPISEAISKDMKKRGFKFFGPTTCYAYLQAIGYVNDHLVDCSFR